MTIARRLLGFVLLLAALLMLAAPVLADNDPLVPGRAPTAQPYAGPPPLYDDDRFPPWNYTFEGDYFDVSGYNTLYFWMNQALVGKAWLLKTSLRVTEYALTTNFFEPFAKRAGTALTALGQQLWTPGPAPLVVAALSLTGLWALVLYLRGRTATVWGTLGGSVVIIMLTALVLTMGTAPISSAVGLSRGLALQVYQGIDRVSKATDKDPPLVVRSGDSAWRTLVFEPWATGEFGSNEGRQRFKSAADNLDGGQFLSMQQDYRRKYVLECQPTSYGQQTTYCPWWNVQYLPRRMFLALTTLLTTVLYGGTLLALAGSIILAQLTLVFLIVLAPVWLLVALWWPGGGVRLVGRILSQALNALISQGVLAATLGVLLLLTRAVEESFPTAGWMTQAILLGVLGALAYRYRYGWLAPLQVSSRPQETAAFGLLEQVRAWMGRGRGPAPVASARASLSATDLLPAFAAIPSPVIQAQVLMPEVERTHTVEPVAVERTSPRAVFQSQMHQLREEIHVREEAIRREQLEQREGGSWEEPTPTPAPDSALGRIGQRARDARNRSSDLTKLPRQRPQA